MHGSSRRRVTESFAHTDGGASSIDGVTRQRRLRLALGFNVGLVALQAVVGFKAHSVGLLADAGHNLTDSHCDPRTPNAASVITAAPSSPRKPTPQPFWW